MYYLKDPKEKLDKSEAKLQKIVETSIHKNLALHERSQLSGLYPSNVNISNRASGPAAEMATSETQTDINTKTFLYLF